MTRQIPLMMTLAVLAVILNHTADWGINAMVWWTDQYQDVETIPCWDQVGTLPYYILMTVKQLTFFAVPAFLFVSGYFVAYAARGTSHALSWKVVRTRILNLLWPYLFWSLILFIADGLEGQIHTPTEYLRQLLVGDATPAYFFVPLLVQLYLLSPLLVRWGGQKGALLFAASGLVQLGMIIDTTYLPIFGVNTSPLLDGSALLFPQHVAYFVLGIVCKFGFRRIQTRLHHFRWVLMSALVTLAVITVGEAELLYRTTENLGWAYSGRTLSTYLYNLTFLICFLAFGNIVPPFKRVVQHLSAQTYGIYLMHSKILELVARVVYHVAPWMLGCQILFQLPLVTCAVGIPLLAMMLVKRSPMRRAYKLLFG